MTDQKFRYLCYFAMGICVYWDDGSEIWDFSRLFRDLCNCAIRICEIWDDESVIWEFCRFVQGLLIGGIFDRRQHVKHLHLVFSRGRVLHSTYVVLPRRLKGYCAFVLGCCTPSTHYARSTQGPTVKDLPLVH